MHCLGKAGVKKGLWPGQQGSAGSPQLWPRLAALRAGLCADPRAAATSHR